MGVFLWKIMLGGELIKDPGSTVGIGTEGVYKCASVVLFEKISESENKLVGNIYSRGKNYILCFCFLWYMSKYPQEKYKQDKQLLP